MIFAWLASAWAAEEPSAGGYVEARAQVLSGVDDDPWQLVERVRPEATIPLHERFALTTTVEAALVQGRDATDPEEVSDYLSVERLYLDAWLPFADVRVGRQAIYWGSAFFVNPTDPFPQVLLTAPWRERAGVGAVRATVPIGERHQFQAVVGSDDVFENVRAAGRGTVNVWNTDVSLVGAYREEADDGIVGLDVRGTAGVGFWLEGAWHLAADPYEEVAAGIDYSFPVLDGLVIRGQYYRNGAGSPDASFLDRLAPSINDPFAPVFYGRDYVMLQTSLVASRAFTGSVVAVQNVGDGSALAVPTLTWVPTGWLDVSGSAQLPFSTWGDGGELHPSASDSVVGGLDLSGLVPNATFTLWTRVSI